MLLHIKQFDSSSGIKWEVVLAFSISLQGIFYFSYNETARNKSELKINQPMGIGEQQLFELPLLVKLVFFMYLI